jgi:hypothetical protein
MNILQLINKLSDGQALSPSEQTYLLGLVGIEEGTPVNEVAATGTLTITDVATLDTVTIGNITYTFSASSGSAYLIALGGTTEETIVNFVSAINEGAGVEVGLGTLPHPQVTAVDNEDGTVTITSRAGVTESNSIVTTASLEDGAFGAETLEGGVDETPGPPLSLRADDEKLYVRVNVSDNLTWKSITFDA